MDGGSVRKTAWRRIARGRVVVLQICRDHVLEEVRMLLAGKRAQCFQRDGIDGRLIRRGHGLAHAGGVRCIRDRPAAQDCVEPGRRQRLGQVAVHAGGQTEVARAGLRIGRQGDIGVWRSCGRPRARIAAVAA